MPFELFSASIEYFILSWLVIIAMSRITTMMTNDDMLNGSNINQ